MEWPISEAQRELWTDRASRLVARARGIAGKRSVRLGALLVVLPLFAAALVFAWREAEIALADLALLPLLVVVGAVPVSVFSSTWQLHAMTRAGGVSIRWWNALRVVTLGTLSGLLPVSSGTVVRGGAVVVWGVTPGAAGKVLAYDAVLWTCLSLLYSGAAALLAGASTLGVAMVVGGAALLPVTLALGRWLPGDGGRLELAISRFVGVIVQVVRLQACFLALGYSATFVEASTLAAASPLASVFFFLPGGIGVREAFTSAVGVAVGLSAAGAFLAAALNRLVGLSVVLAWEGLLLLRPRPESEESLG